MKKLKIQVYNDEPEQTMELSEEEQAQAWYAQAADSDNNHEQAELCRLYSQKDGIDWYLSAAVNGDAYAMYALGKMYYQGIGVDKNDTKSATWFSKASSVGISYAHYELAKICRDGIGLDTDLEYADNLYKMTLHALQRQEKARPDPHAQYILATLYEYGLGVGKDLNLAQYWHDLADYGNGKTEGDDQEQEEVALPLIPAPKLTVMPTTVHNTVPDKPTPLPNPVTDALPIIHPIIQADTSPAPTRENILVPPLPAPQPLVDCQEIREQGRKSQAPKQRPTKAKASKKPRRPEPPKVTLSSSEAVQSLDFLDMITPSVMDFKHPNYFVCGNTFRCVWAIREYPTETQQLAILRELGEKSGITLHIFTRPVSYNEENKIIREAERRNRHKKNNARDLQDSISADVNMKDVVTLITNKFRSKETLMHCAVFFELIASSYAGLQKLQNEAASICTRSKFVCDKLWLRQKEGFLTVMPTGSNQFKSEFERVMPGSSVGNLYPFSYSGKTDANGMYIGEDVNGTNIIIDFDLRSESKTNGHIIILGNSGEGKSYLVKIIIINTRQQGKKLYIIDVENEYRDLTNSLGGCYIDMMSGKHFINVLEPRLWTDDPVTDENEDVPAAFRQTTRLSQHIAFLRDFFRCYKEFSTEQLDTLEILLEKLYLQFHITDNTDYTKLNSENYPILSDLFKLANQELEDYDDSKNQLYTKDVLRSLTLGLRSISVGAESRFFNGFTNITNADFIDFSVMGMMDTNENLKNAMFFNIFSWMSHKFLTEGDTNLVIDELHMFVTNKIAINYLRSFEKRGRKRNSDVIVASQNVEDLLLPGIVEYTKPLFSIPTHSFLFNPGQNCDAKAFQQALSVPDSEWELIKNPRRGHCLFRSGNERYHLHVKAPDYKSELFGEAGGQ